MNEKQFAEITVNIWSLRKVVDEGCWQPHRGQGMCLRQIRILGKCCSCAKGTLMVQPFDARRLALSGEVVPVAEKVGSFLDYGFFSASSNGVLVYKSGVGLDYQLTWFDRQGRVLAKVAEPGRYNSLALSPDGRRVAVSRTNPENTPNWDVWLLDEARNTSRDGRFGAGDRNRAVLNTGAGVTVQH